MEVEDSQSCQHQRPAIRHHHIGHHAIPPYFSQPPDSMGLSARPVTRWSGQKAFLEGTEGDALCHFICKFYVIRQFSPRGDTLFNIHQFVVKSDWFSTGRNVVRGASAILIDKSQFVPGVVTILSMGKADQRGTATISGRRSH